MECTVWILVFAGRFLVWIVHIVPRWAIVISARHWSNDGVIAWILVRHLGLTIAIRLIFVLIDHFADRGHCGNRRFGKQTFGLFELTIPLLRFRIRALRWGQVSVPTTDYVAVQLSVFQIGAFERINLALQIGQCFLKRSKTMSYRVPFDNVVHLKWKNYRDFSFALHQIGQFSSCVHVGCGFGGICHFSFSLLHRWRIFTARFMQRRAHCSAAIA